MEITRKLLYHAAVVKNVALEEPDIGEKAGPFLIELNTDDGQYHSISLSDDAARQLLQQLSLAIEKT